jgi:hypothetical protein
VGSCSINLYAGPGLEWIDSQTLRGIPRAANPSCLRLTRSLQGTSTTICPKLFSSPSDPTLSQDLQIPCPVYAFPSSLTPGRVPDFDCLDRVTSLESEAKIQKREWHPNSPVPFDRSSTDTYLGGGAIFSAYLRSLSPSCSSIQETQDCNAKPHVDVFDDSSAPTSHLVLCETELIDHEPDRLHEDSQVKPDRRRVRLRIKPPKPQIILTVAGLGYVRSGTSFARLPRPMSYYCRLEQG